MLVVHAHAHVAAVTCPAMTLANGAVTGSCGGNYNDTCTYASCNAGFTLSTNGSLVRTCNQSGMFSGTPSVCLGGGSKLILYFA